ncbi:MULTISPECIES: CheR family methyltransferase [Modicisalibacter]|uniref:CheR family methyltransferase n=1 Tax=Modicisalibacter TaxID=574347 RepID=UPI00100A3C02|nr:MULTISPECIES: CheR family methyltransferase [Halomonadaceae]MBZ9558813.1 SAM-dependent methyltransferase [Modicisalibacter sp. R2A 31.J]MBZ9575296.1 SAM-dependent methyltransferase [Modicisalibacter sp. MOD 31.J]
MNGGDEGLSPADHRRVAHFVERQAGIRLPTQKRHLIEVRLRKRQRAIGQATLQGYLDFALSPAGAQAAEPLWLVDALTTNKTDFFREPAHFQALADHVRHVLAPRREIGWARPLSVWSAACSTGEEPYTLAIVLRELQAELTGFDFRIEATDIAPSVLETARRACYPAPRIEPVAEVYRRRYFLRSRDPQRGVIKMGPELRSVVRFSTFNLITGQYPGKPRHDVIFCRNVMIYFGDADRQRVIAGLRDALQPGGLLFIGHSESLGGAREGFEPVVPTVYRKLT